MKERILINSSRIDGIQLIGNKFPSLTKRQVNEVYAVASSQKMTLEEIEYIETRNHDAKIGESFGITVSKLSEHAEK